MKGLSRNKRTLSLLVLLLIVCASATQTELANYMTAQRGYSKPYFTFFLTHSFFVIIFPLHLFALRYLKPSIPVKQHLKNLRLVVADQLELDPRNARAVHVALTSVIVKLTVLISFPSISWYIAVPLTGTTDLTTLYATATFWTYGFSLLLLKTPLSRSTVAAIVVAFFGVVLITYSGYEDSKHPKAGGEGDGSVEKRREPPHRILGDLIMLIGAILLGLYEVIYKLALPEGHGGVAGDNDDNPDEAVGEGYKSVPEAEDDDRPAYPRSDSSTVLLPSPSRLGINTSPIPQAISPSSIKLPLALHANFLTSLIGFATLALFWIPLPAIHYMGWEDFEWPRGSWGLMVLICASGATYNAGFMILIGLLGPTTASVANLLTIGLVALLDSVWLGRSIPFLTLIGAGLVGAGFAVLMMYGEDEGKRAVTNENEFA